MVKVTLINSQKTKTKQNGEHVGNWRKDNADHREGKNLGEFGSPSSTL